MTWSSSNLQLCPQMLIVTVFCILLAQLRRHKSLALSYILAYILSAALFNFIFSFEKTFELNMINID